MGVKVVETIQVTCDRCGEESEYSCKTAAVANGWMIGPSPSPRYPELVLCPLDGSRLLRFLQGDKTGASMRFNRDEDQRWTDSCA